ncbi:MAG: DNA primase DnaG [Candidatus Micrarchaeaceae archaeon]
MAKTYLDIVKYMIVVNFGIEGLVDKPDIIGAVFGQTEGLLGNELDLRELQKGGKIGRIEIDVSQSGNKTYGRLYLPASLDRIDTCILGAAVESVDRVGPFDAKFQVERVEDTRSEKRRKIIERAKDLLKKLLSTELPDSRELAELVESEVKVAEISSYGPEHLPAGPDVAKSDEVIIVEGRADVLNLLKNSVSNVVAVGGATANIPKSIIGLASEKEVTVFVDGDRGGDMIVRALANAMDIDYVTKAPEGKEVEELTQKEIIKALRSKVPLSQYLANAKAKENARHAENYGYAAQSLQRQQEHAPQQDTQADKLLDQQKGEDAPSGAKSGAKKQGVIGFEEISAEEEGLQSVDIPKLDGVAAQREPERREKPVLESVLLAQLSSGLAELAGTLRSRLYASDGSVIKEAPIRELLNELQGAQGVYGVVLDGVVTQRLVELALQKGVKAIYGIRSNPMPKLPSDMIIYTKEQGKLS